MKKKEILKNQTSECEFYVFPTKELCVQYAHIKIEAALKEYKPLARKLKKSRKILKPIHDIGKVLAISALPLMIAGCAFLTIGTNMQYKMELENFANSQDYKIELQSDLSILEQQLENGEISGKDYVKQLGKVGKNSYIEDKMEKYPEYSNLPKSDKVQKAYTHSAVCYIAEATTLTASGVLGITKKAIEKRNKKKIKRYNEKYPFMPIK